ncbi:MAG: hypothetical protein HYU67_01635 [Flavobacteriia bacterium]|nr:hypothetical protein [Flavobacteriia bacterium]
MKIISTKSIEDAFNFLESESDELVHAYNEKIIKEQELLLHFAADTVNAFYQKEEDIEKGFYDVFYYLTIFYKAFENENCTIQKINEADLEELDKVFPPFLEEYYEEGDPNTILAFINQPYLIDFILYELSEENEENEFDDNESNLLFMAGLSILYLLNKVQK